MMACHFSFNLIDSIWVGRLIGPAALAAVSTAGFYIWVALSLGEMVEIGLIAVAARRHGEGFPDRAARAAAAAVAYALGAGLAVSIIGWAVAGPMFRVMRVPPDVATLGHAYLSTWLLGAPLVFGFFAIEATFRAAPGPTGSARLLPSGDAYFLLQGDDRELLVPDVDRRRALWTPRVWPGGVLVKGEVVGTWRRAEATVTVQAWRRLSRAARDAVEAEAESLPLPGLAGRIVVRWED